MTDPTPSPVPQPEEGDDDRRTSIRCSCRMLASCEPAEGETAETYAGTIRNLSETGMLLLLGHPFAPGTVLSVTMRLTVGGILDRVQVSVMWTRPQDGEWLHGCNVIERHETDLP